jgi:large subunit ribosomal protein L32
MSVPSKRKNKSRTNRGRSHDALKKIKLVKCAKCGKPTKPHQVCLACGSYQGKEIIKLKVKKKKENK